MKKILIFLLFLNSTIGLAQSIKATNWGGNREFKRIFEQEVYYSSLALEKNYGGLVQLSFDLDTNGQVSEIQIQKSVSKDLNAEAIRLLNILMWNPAEKDGRKIASSETLKFKFNPIKYTSICHERGYDLEAPDQNYMFRVFDESEVSSKPLLIGDYANFNAFVEKSLEYPYEALKNKAQGNVEINFIVETSGRITNLYIKESLEVNCDIVALDLLEKTKWKSATKNGIPVRCLVAKKIFFSPGK